MSLFDPAPCIRCGKVGLHHIGWDPKGPVCKDCWIAEVDDFENERHYLEEQEMRDRECLG